MTGYDLEIVISVGTNGNTKKEAIAEIESFLPKIKSQLNYLKDFIPMPIEAYKVRIKPKIII